MLDCVDDGCYDFNDNVDDDDPDAIDDDDGVHVIIVGWLRSIDVGAFYDADVSKNMTMSKGSISGFVSWVIMYEKLLSLNTIYHAINIIDYIYHRNKYIVMMTRKSLLNNYYGFFIYSKYLFFTYLKN